VSDPVIQSRRRRRHSYDVNGTDGYQLEKMVPKPPYESARGQRTISDESIGHLSDFSENNSNRTSEKINERDIPTTNDNRTSADIR